MKRRTLVTATLAILGLTAGIAVTASHVGAAGDTKTFAAALLGSNETPAGDPDGTGSATVTVNTGTNEVCWDVKVSGLAPVTLAHIHNAAAGINGPVKVDFAGVLAGCKVVDVALATDIAANPANYYVNIHTGEHTGGAVRGQLASSAAGPLGFFALDNPLRSYDSRQGGTKIQPNETRNIIVVSGKTTSGAALPAVPLGATAAQVVITVTETGPTGYLAAHAGGTPVPATSTINWEAAGSSVAVSAIVPVDATGRIALSAGPTATTHVIVDVTGYYRGGASPTPTSTTMPIG